MTDFEAIVIGSGLGGLTTAAYLTANGLRTLVLEQYDVVGGSSHVFRRKRAWEFDVGVHYIGDCGPNGLISATLRGVGLDGRIDFAPMDPDGFDTLIFPGLTFRVPAGWDNYRDRLVETFPSEQRGLDRCISTMRGIAGELRTADAPASPLDAARFVLRNRRVVRWSRHSLADLFDRCELSERARAVLAGEAGNYGLPPSRASALIHSLITDHYLRDGAFYPRGGGQVFAAHLTDVVRSHGGDVRTQAKVDRILVNKGAVEGVGLAGGEQITAPVVVSNADLKQTMLKMIDPGILSSKTLKRVRRYKMAPPLFTQYLGLDIDLAADLPNTNYFIAPHFDIEAQYREVAEGRLPDKVTSYVSSASLKDPSNPHVAPAGCSAVEIMTIVPSNHEFWGIAPEVGGGPGYRRNPAYLERKRQVGDHLLDAADQVIPGIRKHILWREESTPITHQRYTLASGGTSYGIECSAKQSGPRRPAPKTELTGLYLAGASTVFGHGVAGVMFGGIRAASAILGRDLLTEVSDGAVFGDPSKLTATGPEWDPLAVSRRLAVKSRRQKASDSRGKKQQEATEPVGLDR